MNEFLYEAVSAALIRSVPVAALGLLLLALVRKGSGANRHMVCAATLGVLFALPILTLIPQRQTAVLPSAWHAITRPMGIQQPTLERIAATPMYGGAIGHSGPSITLAQLLAGVYFIGLVLLVVRQIGSIRAAAKAVNTSIQVPFDSPYPVRMSEGASVPMATWWRQPTILLPAAASEWSESRLTASVEHEASHIRRGDLAYTVLGSLMKLLYWPNPLIWILTLKLVESAELATDDCVLGSGVSASDYADVLVQTASERRRAVPIFSLSMARSSQVGRRVRAILDPRRHRGSVQPLGLILTGAVLLGGAIGVSQIGARFQGLARVAIPQAGYDDIQKGLTVPAEARNDYVAVDAAGRQVQLVQIQRWTPSGVEAWKPDGTRLPESEIISDDWHRHNSSELHLYSRMAKDPKINFQSAGIGSGPYSPNDPPTLVFSGGYVMHSLDSSPTETAVSFLGVPQPGSSGMTSVTFGYSDTSGKPIVTLYPNGDQPNVDALDGALKDEFVPDFASTVKLDYPAYGTPFIRDSKGEGIPDGHGNYLHSKVLSTKLTYTEKTYSNGNHDLEPVAYRVGTLQKIDHDWNDAKQREALMDNFYYWPVEPQDIDHIDLLVHKTYHVAYLNIAVRPRQDVP